MGASAGGLESLTAVVSRLPADFRAPVVIGMHVSPSRRSSLAEILGRRGPLPVSNIEGRTPLEPGRIYVVPANRNVRIVDGHAELEEVGGGPHPSVDLMFRSAAEAYGEDLIAVVLSGTGSDGALGAREVKSAGGTVIVQDPENAAYPGMPLSLSLSDVDVTADLDRIGSLLVEFVSGSYAVPTPSDPSQLRAFLEELREETGVDFTNYRHGTIQRRIQRRMAATSQTSFQDYVRYMREDPEERQRLAKSFLINVTKFFRDPELFEYLREQILPELLREARLRNDELRIWSAGCSTGEEAFSLAMIVDELLDQLQVDVTVRIFATDLDEEAVAFARRGVYPARALDEMPDDVVERYFTPIGDEYEVRKHIRSMLVFGEHDLSRRAPFPRIDLILCRNVLIYFTPPLQRRALELFAFSLRNGGYLVLGKSETARPLGEHFALDQGRLKVFRRVGERRQILRSNLHDAMLLPPSKALIQRPHGSAPLARAGTERRQPDPPRPSWDREHILYALPYGLVIVNRSYDIQYINNQARSLLGIHTTAMEQDLIHLIQRFDPLQVRRLIDTVVQTKDRASEILTAGEQAGDALQSIELVGVPIDGRDEQDPNIAVTIVNVTEREQMRRRLAAAEESAARLASANEEVLLTNHQLNQALQRLRDENEQLQVASAEIQAATEEVETLNEELQASNEELETLNEELQATVEELNTTNDDLEARSLELQTIAVNDEAARRQLRGILDALDDGVVVVDGNGAIMLQNSMATSIFGPGIDAGAFLDQDGEPMAADHTPITRAARGDTFSMTFRLQRQDDTMPLYEAIGRPVAVSGPLRLGVFTVRLCPEKEPGE